MFGSLDRCLRSLSRRFTTPPPLPSPAALTRISAPPRRHVQSRTPERPSCWDATVIGSEIGPDSARGILVGMNLAGPSGTNKQLPTTPPPPQPLLSSVKPQKREEGKRKNPKCFLFPQLFRSVSVLCWVVCRNKSSRPGLVFFQPS